MTYLNETSTWEEGIYQIEVTDRVSGGASGVANIQPRQLASRTKWLKDAINNLASNNPSTLSLTAGENVATHSVVFIATTLDSQVRSLTSGRVYLSDNRNLYSITKICGITTNGGSDGEPVNIQQTGILGGFTDLVTGNNYYVGVSGAITNIKPSEHAVFVGVATSSTELNIMLSDLDSINFYPYGYILGGNTSTIYVAVVTADKIMYSTDTTSVCSSANLPEVNTSAASISSDTRGYTVGGSGYLGDGTPLIKTFKVQYANDTTAVCYTANLGTGVAQATGVSADTKGYIMGGGGTNIEFGTKTNSTSKLLYSTETISLCPAANLSVEKGGAFGISADTKGYVLGGHTVTVDTSAYIVLSDKVVYSTDITSACSTSNLTTARAYGASVSSDIKGYMLGGFNGTNNLGMTDKILYATDTTSSCSTANLSVNKRESAGISADTKGYMLGGVADLDPNITERTDMILYATEITAACSTANLSQARFTANGLSGYNYSAVVNM